MAVSMYAAALAYRHNSQELQDPSLFVIHVIRVDHGDNSGFKSHVYCI